MFTKLNFTKSNFSFLPVFMLIVSIIDHWHTVRRGKIWCTDERYVRVNEITLNNIR